MHDCSWGGTQTQQEARERAMKTGCENCRGKCSDNNEGILVYTYQSIYLSSYVCMYVLLCMYQSTNMDEWMNEWMNVWMNLSINQMNQSNESTKSNQPINQSIKEPKQRPPLPLWRRTRQQNRRQTGPGDQSPPGRWSRESHTTHRHR